MVNEPDWKSNGEKRRPLQTFSKASVFLAALETEAPLDQALLSSGWSQGRLSNRDPNTGTIVFSEGKTLTLWLFHLGLQLAAAGCGLTAPGHGGLPSEAS